MDRKGVSERQPFRDMATAFTHQPVQEARGSGHMGIWTAVAGRLLQSKWQMALPAAEGRSAVRLSASWGWGLLSTSLHPGGGGMTTRHA